MANIKDMIEKPHIVYQDNANYWNFLLNSYEGGIDYSESGLKKTTQNVAGFNITVNGSKLNKNLNSNLWKHKREMGEDFARRQEQSYYYNFCAPIIDIYTNHLFRQPVNSDFGSIESIVEQRMDNVDRMGSSLIEFRKQVATLAQVYGHIFVLTDMPQANIPIISEQSRIDGGVFPYFTIFHPQKVVNWALDEFGKPYWVLLCVNKDSNNDPETFKSDNTTDTFYLLWTRKDWTMYDDKYNIVDTDVHNLGEVPLTVIFDKPSFKYRNFLGISSIADIALIARNVYNLNSYLMEIIRNQAFSMLTIQGEASEYDNLTVSTQKALLYPVDRQQPNFIAPPDGPADTIMRQIDVEVHKMFQLAKLEGGSAKQDQQVTSQSGISKAFDFQETNSALSKKADNLEDGELKLWSDFARWEGKEFDGSVDYPDEFSVQDLNTDLEEAEMLFKMNLGKQFDLEVKKEIIRKKLPRASEDKIEEILQEVENQPQGNGSLLNRIPALASRLGGTNGRGNTNNGNRGESPGQPATERT